MEVEISTQTDSGVEICRGCGCMEKFVCLVCTKRYTVQRSFFHDVTDAVNGVICGSMSG